MSDQVRKHVEALLEDASDLSDSPEGKKAFAEWLLVQRGQLQALGAVIETLNHLDKCDHPDTCGWKAW
jgi:hypothetical protein